MASLSRVSTLILSIVDEKKVNPYEIIKILEKIHIKDWFSVASSSVYVTVKNLEKKEYITGETMKDRNMPEKTVYSITEKGKKVLSQSLIDFILNRELDVIKFNIACMMLCHLKKDEALKALNKRLLILNGYKNGIKEHYLSIAKDKRVPYLGLTVIRQNICLVEVEIKITQELLFEVKKDYMWDHFITKDI